jgi:hypothetical protein
LVQQVIAVAVAEMAAEVLPTAEKMEDGVAVMLAGDLLMVVLPLWPQVEKRKKSFYENKVEA